MNTIRIAVVGEGSTDYGREEYDPKSGVYKWAEGPIFSIIQNTAEQIGQEVLLEAVNKKDVYKMRRQRCLSKLHGLSGKANDSARFSFYLAMHRYQYGIFYCDADKEASKRNTDLSVCRKLFRRVHEEVLNGCMAAGVEDLKVIPMIPLKMIECWLLADEKAYQELFGIRNPDLPTEPELIWGEIDNPKSNYPKNYLKRVLEKASQADVVLNRETYKRIAESTDIETLKRKCAISFLQFYRDFSELLESL